LKRHGLTVAPKLAIGDGSLGFWLALQEEYGPMPQQRCWVHKTANILDKMPKSVQGRAKDLIHEMYLSPTRKLLWKPTINSSPVTKPSIQKQPTAWKKTKNGCSPFMTSSPALVASANDQPDRIHLFHGATSYPENQGMRLADRDLTMVFKLAAQAQQHWRRLNGSDLIPKVLTGAIFVDGEELEQQAA
jgi:hypothetical protein